MIEKIMRKFSVYFYLLILIMLLLPFFIFGSKLFEFLISLIYIYVVSVFLIGVVFFILVKIPNNSLRIFNILTDVFVVFSIIALFLTFFEFFQVKESDMIFDVLNRFYIILGCITSILILKRMIKD